MWISIIRYAAVAIPVIFLISFGFAVLSSSPKSWASNLPAWWGVTAIAAAFLIGGGAALCWMWWPIHKYLDRLGEALSAMGYQPCADASACKVVTDALRGTMLDSDLYFGVSRIWRKSYDRFTITWGQLMRSGKSLESGIFVVIEFDRRLGMQATLLGREGARPNDEFEDCFALKGHKINHVASVLPSSVKAAIIAMRGYVFQLVSSRLIAEYQGHHPQFRSRQPVEGQEAAVTAEHVANAVAACDTLFVAENHRRTPRKP